MSTEELVTEDKAEVTAETVAGKVITENKAEVTAEEAEPGLTSSIFPEPSEESVDTENI